MNDKNKKFNIAGYRYRGIHPTSSVQSLGENPLKFHHHSSLKKGKVVDYWEVYTKDINYVSHAFEDDKLDKQKVRFLDRIFRNK